MHRTESLFEERQGQVAQRTTTARQDFSNQMLLSIRVARHERTDGAYVGIRHHKHRATDQFIMTCDIEVNPLP